MPCYTISCLQDFQIYRQDFQIHLQNFQEFWILLPPFPLLCLIQIDKEITPESPGSSPLLFPYCFLLKFTPESSGSCPLPFPYRFLLKSIRKSSCSYFLIACNIHVTRYHALKRADPCYTLSFPAMLHIFLLYVFVISGISSLNVWPLVAKIQHFLFEIGIRSPMEGDGRNLIAENNKQVIE